MKRIFDVVFALLILALALPIMTIIAIRIHQQDGGKVFYISERMKTPNHPFSLIKFRTMTNVPPHLDTGVTGGDKADRITPIGRILRKLRLDELPQLLNILRGDMSFVGPRPPLRQYTDAFPDLYKKVLQTKPGLTGLATLHFHRHEERLIKTATTKQQTEAIYTTRCIPRKARLDLIYAKHASVFFDAAILLQTLRSVLRR